MTGRRVLLGAVLPAALLAVALLPWLLAWGDLPGTVATHFTAGGDADGSMSRGAAFVVHAAVAVVTAGGLAVAVRRPGAALPGIAAFCGFLGALFAVISVSMVVVNRGLDDWRDADLSILWVAVAIAVSIAVGALAATAAMPLVPAGAWARPPAPALPLGATERAAWFGGARSRGFWLAAVVAAAVGVGLTVLVEVAALVALLLAAVFAAFASVRVVVGDGGVVVRSGALPFVRVRIPLDDVESAGAIHVVPAAVGGWGYRGSLRLFRRAAWVVRRGPGLELRLAGGRRFAVTVDDPEDGAAVLNGLLTSTRR